MRFRKIAIAFALLGSVAAFSLVQSCKIVKPKESYMKTEDTDIKLTPVDVPVKGATVTSSLNVDSVAKAYAADRAKYIIDSVNAVNAGKPIPPPHRSDPKKFTDPQTKAELTYWMDEFGKLQMKCESKDQVVTMLTAEITRLTKEVTAKTEIVKETPVWNYILMSVLSTLLILSVIINLFMFKRK